MTGAPPLELNFSTRVLMKHHKPTAAKVMSLWWEHYCMDMHLRPEVYTAAVEALNDPELLEYWHILLPVIHLAVTLPEATPEFEALDAAGTQYLADHPQVAKDVRLAEALNKLHDCGIPVDDIIACRDLAGVEHIYGERTPTED